MISVQSIECPICFEIYRDPRVLKCGHTICRPCLTSCLIQEHFTCPICRLHLPSDNIDCIPKNFNLVSLLPEFLKLKKDHEIHSKVQETLLRQIEDLKLQIKNNQSYLDISSAKLKIAESSLHKKKQEVEQLYKDLHRFEKKQMDGKCRVHNNIIIKLEMKVEDLKNRIKVLISTYKECGGLPKIMISDLESEFFGKDVNVKNCLDETGTTDFSRSVVEEGTEGGGKRRELGKSKEFGSFDLYAKPFARLPSVQRSRSILKKTFDEIAMFEAEINKKASL